MSFSKEPVAWLSLILVVVQIVIGLLTDSLDTALFTSLATAASAVFIRQNVKPNKFSVRVNEKVE